MDFLDIIFRSVDGLLNRNKTSNFALYGPRPDNFFKVALDKCKSFEENHLLKNRDFSGDTLPILSKELKEMIRTVIRAHDPLGHFSISSEIPVTIASINRFVNENIIPGHCFGMMPQNVDSIASGNNIYPELKEKVVNNLVRQVFERSLKDFVVMKTIFKEIHEHCSVTIIPLPVHIYVKQVVALKKKFNIPFDKPLPEKLGTFLACVSCRSFKGPLSVVRRKMRKNTKKKKVSAEKMKNDRREYEYYIIGNQRVLIDEDTDRLYCKGNKNKNEDKKQTKNLFPNVPENSALSCKQKEDAEKKLIKNALKERNETKCNDTELTRISLVGNAFRFFGKCYVLCPSCATPFEYNWTKFGYGQLTCRKCPSKEMLDRDIRCVFCNKTEERNDKTNTYKILEPLSTDENEYESRQDLQLKKVFLCKKHDVGGKQNFNGNTREQLFALVEEIQAKKSKK